MRRSIHGGFTLLELLVVMFIIGIIAAMATLSLGVATRERDADRELRRLRDLIALAGEEAVLQGREFGVAFSSRGYAFAAYEPQSRQWVAIEGRDQPFTPHRFAPDVIVELDTDGRQVRLQTELPSVPRAAESKSPTADARRAPTEPTRQPPFAPHVLILSSGEITPFELRMQPDIGKTAVTLRSEAGGPPEVLLDEA